MSKISLAYYYFLIYSYRNKLITLVLYIIKIFHVSEKHEKHEKKNQHLSTLKVMKVKPKVGTVSSMDQLILLCMMQ